jgi:hypothetical protein
MVEASLLIPGRTSARGTTLNNRNDTEEYVTETHGGGMLDSRGPGV